MLRRILRQKINQQSQEILPFEGGLPVETGGDIIGAVGVSGATPQQDGEIAKSGLDVI